MSEALKPCPFCGADIAQLREGSDLMWGYCLECRAEGPPSLKTGGNSSAIAAWNRRAPSVTREEIAEAAERILAEDAEGCFHHLGMKSPDDCINRECPCRRLTLGIADAILALFGGE